MSATQRIYIGQAVNGDASLVKATNQAQALRHVAKSIYTVRAATALEVAEEMEAGQKIADATKEPEPTTEDKE